MSAVESILGLLDERTIAQNVTNKHDEARVQFPLKSNRVGSFEEFTDVVSNYYGYHFAACVANGGRLSKQDAWSKARSALEQEYRRSGGDIVSAFHDAHDGTNSGMRLLLDKLSEALKTEAVRNYVTYVFDSYVSPNEWQAKVEIIREFIERCGVDLSTSINPDEPERYAHEYRTLIQAYVEGLRQTSAAFRRL